MMAMVTPQSLQMSRFSHSHNGSTAVTTPANFIHADSKITSSVSASPQKASANIILKRVHNHNRNYVGKHSQLMHDTTPRFGNKSKPGRMHSQDYSHGHQMAASVGRNTPDPQHNSSPIKTRKRMTINSTDSEYVKGMGSMKDQNDRNYEEGIEDEGFGHRKQSVNSHLMYAGSKNLLTKQKRVSFRHGPLRGIRIGEKVMVPQKHPTTPSQEMIDDFSLSGQSLIPQYHNPRGSLNPPPSTAPINPNRSIISNQEPNDQTFINHSPETQHPALREILRYSKQQQELTSNMLGEVSPPLIGLIENGVSPAQSPTARSSFSHQQMQLILNQHKTKGALSHSRLHQEEVEVPSTLQNTKDYFPSPPRFHRSQISKSSLRKSQNYSNGTQLNNSSMITTYLQSPIGKNQLFKQNNGGLGAGNTVPIVQSHNSKVTAQQCISMNPHPKEPSDISSFFLPYSSHNIVRSQKRQDALIRGAHRSSLFTIADVPNSLTAMERSLITASQNCLHTTSDMNLTLNEGIEQHSVGQTYNAFMDISRVRYLGLGDNELKKAKSEVVSKHKTVCPFHKKMIWLSLGQPLKQTLNGLRKMKNKNPNCNHNNNSMLYQPLLSANKLEEILKHKEDALKNLYFATSLPENKAKKMHPYAQNDFRLELSPLKVGGGSLLDQIDPPKTERNSTSPINKEMLRGSTSSPDIHHSAIARQKQTRIPSLPKSEEIPRQIQQLEKATGRHKHFIYALLRVNKIVRENFLKILQDSKNMLTYRNESCIFCYAVLPISMLFFNGLISTHSISASSGNYTPSVVPISKLMATATTQAALNAAALAQSPEVAATAATNTANFQRNIGIVKFLGTIFQKVVAPPPAKSPQKGANSQPPSTQKKKPEGGREVSSFRRPKLDLKDKRAILKGGDKEKLQEYRELIFRDYLKKMNDSNGIIVAPPTGVFLPYKCYIGRGNNSILVKMAFKSRWWWSVVEHEEWENYNFAWTQWKSQRMMSTLKKHNEVVNELNNSSLLTSASSSSTCAVSSNVSNQGSTIKLLEENSSTQNLHINESGSTSPTPRVKLGDERSSQRRLSSSLTAKKRGINSGIFNSGLKPVVRAGSTEKEQSSKKNEVPKKKRELTKEGNLREVSHSLHTCNHIQAHYHLSNKKALFLNMKLYYEALNEDMFQFMPVTFHLTEGTESKEWDRFQECYHTLQSEIEQGDVHHTDPKEQTKEDDQEEDPDSSFAKKSSYPEKEALMKQRRKKQRNLWIVKPGENTNRGFGIIVARDLQHIKELVSQIRLPNGIKRSYIVQKYIDRPLLFHRRKFDIRCYAMITSTNGNVKGYFYQDGYLRTACKDFSVKNINNRFIHLTNDAIQKRHQDYGKFESGNKLSYNDFQRYMDNHHPEMKMNMQKEVVAQIKRIVTDTVKATYKKIDPNRRHQSFEIFGYDFMVDEDKKVLLIEVNTNPCLELSCPLLARLIPQMIENAMRVAVDPLFPPPHPWPNSKKNHIPDFQSENKFELVFNEATDAGELNNLPFHNAPIGDIIEEEEDENDSSSGEEDSDQV